MPSFLFALSPLLVIFHILFFQWLFCYCFIIIYLHEYVGLCWDVYRRCKWTARSYWRAPVAQWPDSTSQLGNMNAPKRMPSTAPVVSWFTVFCCWSVDSLFFVVGRLIHCFLLLVGWFGVWLFGWVMGWSVGTRPLCRHTYENVRSVHAHILLYACLFFRYMRLCIHIILKHTPTRFRLGLYFYS